MLEQPLKGNQKLKMGQLKTSDESPSESQQNNVKTPTEKQQQIYSKNPTRSNHKKNLQRILPGTHKYYPKNCTKFPVETYRQPSTSTTKHTNKRTPKPTNTNTLTIIQHHTNSQPTTHKPTVIHKTAKASKSQKNH